MTNPPRWRVARTEPVQDCAVFRVERVFAESPRGAGVHPFYRIDAEAWCNVVAVTPDDDLVMVRQYRHGSRSVTLEIPGGIVDPGEEPGDAALRELLEETGYRAERAEPLGVVNPNPALFGNRCHTFLARRAEKVAEVSNSAVEETRVELVRHRDLGRLLDRGEIDHALVVAALHWYALHRQREEEC